MNALPIEGEPDEAGTGGRIRRSLTELSRTLASAGRRTRKHADDEAIHDVRVAARRLTSALSVWRDSLRVRPRRKAVRRLRRLRRKIGPARELEVHVRALEAMAGKPSFVLKMAVGDLLVSLRVELGRARRAAAAASQRHIRRIVRNVRRAANDTAGAARTRAAAARLAEIAAQTRQRIAGGLGSDDDHALHRVRIAAKKWRYALEAEERVTEVPAGPLVATLRSVQKVLGEVHDHATLRARLESEADRLKGGGLNAQAAALGTAIEKLEAERRRSVDQFQTLAAALLQPSAGPAAPGSAGAR